MTPESQNLSLLETSESQALGPKVSALNGVWLRSSIILKKIESLGHKVHKGQNVEGFIGAASL